MGSTCSCPHDFARSQQELQLQVEEPRPGLPTIGVACTSKPDVLDQQPTRASKEIDDSVATAAASSCGLDRSLAADTADSGSPAGESPPAALPDTDGVQLRLYREALGMDRGLPPPVPGSAARRPSTENMTFDEYVDSHGDEFGRLLALEPADGWDFKREEESVRMFTKHVPGVPHVYFKATSHLQSEKGIAGLLNIMLDTEKRPSWDELCISGMTLQYFPPFYKRSRVRMRSPIAFITPRELVLEGRLRFEGDGALLISIRSVESPDAPMSDEYVRAKFVEGGYIIRPSPGSLTDFSVTWTGCVDPSGWIPARVANLVAVRQGQTLAKLKKFL